MVATRPKGSKGAPSAKSCTGPKPQGYFPVPKVAQPQPQGPATRPQPEGPKAAKVLPSHKAQPQLPQGPQPQGPQLAHGIQDSGVPDLTLVYSDLRSGDTTWEAQEEEAKKAQQVEMEKTESMARKATRLIAMFPEPAASTGRTAVTAPAPALASRDSDRPAQQPQPGAEQFDGENEYFAEAKRRRLDALRTATGKSQPLAPGALQAAAAVNLPQPVTVTELDGKPDEGSQGTGIASAKRSPFSKTQRFLSAKQVPSRSRSRTSLRSATPGTSSGTRVWRSTGGEQRSPSTISMGLPNDHVTRVRGGFLQDRRLVVREAAERALDRRLDYHHTHAEGVILDSDYEEYETPPWASVLARRIDYLITQVGHLVSQEPPPSTPHGPVTGQPLRHCLPSTP